METISLALGKNSSGWMDFLQIIVVIALVVGLSYLVKRRRGSGSNLEAAIHLIGDIRHNVKVLSTFSATSPTLKKLKTGAWKRNYESISFLDEQTRNYLTSACKLSEEFNACVDDAKRHQSTAYLGSISLDVLKESLDKSRMGLSSWIRDNYQKEMPVKRNFFW